MTDEQSVQEPEAINEPAVEDNSVAAPPVDEPTTSDPTEETDGEAEEAPVSVPAAEDDTNEESERKPSRAERRIHQLTDKVEQLSQPNQPAQGYGQPPQLPTYEEGQNVSPEQLQSDVVQAAQAIAGATVNQALAQQQAKSNFNLDLQSLQSNETIQGLPEIEEAITDEFQQRAFKEVGRNPYTGEPIYQLDPSVRLADIAKRHLKVADAAAKRSSADMKNSVAKTADTAALKPSVSTRQDKSLSEMTEDEIETKLKSEGRYIRA